MRINHNITALNTYNKLSSNQAATSKSLEKLSSGLKINKAGDNAAGLAISEKMRGQIRGLDQASTNASDAISLINTAEGALSETHSILQRMRELAVQSSNDTNVTVDRSEIQKEMNQLTSEINRIGNTTEFNTQKLLDGGGSKVNPLATSATTAGGAAGSVGTAQTVTTSSTGKSLASFKVGAYTISIEGKNTATNLGGKTINFVEQTGASGIAVAVDDIEIAVSDTTTIDDIQGWIDASSAFGSAGNGAKITVTSGDGSIVAGTEDMTTFTSAADLETATAVTSFSAASPSNVSKGVYSIDVTNAFVKDGDKFNLRLATSLSPDGYADITLRGSGGVANTFSGAAAGNIVGTFNIGAADGTTRLSAEQQAANIATALKTGAWDLGGGKKVSDVYDVSTNGTSIIFTEKEALGAQATLKNGAYETTNAVAGVSTYDHTANDMVEVGGSFIIDDVEISVVDGTGENDAADIAAGKAILKTDTQGNDKPKQIELLAEAVNRNAQLNVKYTADGTTIPNALELTQNTGYESSTGPVMKTSTKAGQTFNANFQIGANTAQSMTIEIKDMRAGALNITGNKSGGTVSSKDGTVSATLTSTKEVTDGTSNTGSEYALDVSTHEKATAAITIINDAIQAVSAERSKLGSYSNRLEHTINNLGTSSENMTSAESRIRDVDMAKEMMEFTKNNILSQAAQSMLAQANQQPQGVLQLLQ